MKPENPYYKQFKKLALAGVSGDAESMKRLHLLGDVFEEGFKFATQYWDSPCNKHPMPNYEPNLYPPEFIEYNYQLKGYYYKHSILCPQCRKEGGLE